MKFLLITGIFMLVSIVSGSSTTSAAGPADFQFLTVLVGDYNSNRKEYIDYIRTAASVPQEVTLLALQVATYTDDSYTTMLTNSNLNVATLRSFATRLPWYTRLESELSAAGGASGSSGSSISKASSMSSMSSSKSTGGVAKYAPHGALVGVIAVLLL